MSTPIPQLSSLLLKTKGLPAIGPTVSLWLNLVESETEFLALCTALRGIPANWVDWAEDIVNQRIARGVIVLKPLPYRLAILRNGMVNLQECKYLVDAMENALRVEALEHARKVRIELGDITHRLPDFSKYNPAPTTLPAWIASSTFSHLTELFTRNWTYVWISFVPGKVRVPGFWQVFQDNKHCRDVNQFRRAMASARRYRNDIAHTRRLFTFTEIQHLYNDMSNWFEAMHLDIGSRVKNYRSVRPKFLDGLM